jgi:AcrR family transcriptional regulator
LQSTVTEAITEAVLGELVDRGYARLSMEGVAKRAGSGKSALYRRWATKEEMVLAVLAEIALPMSEVPDTGTLAGDIHATVVSVASWLTTPPFSRIIPDLIAEAHRVPGLADALTKTLAEPRRSVVHRTLERCIARGELAPDTDMEMAEDLVAALTYWRIVVLQAPTEPGYLDHVTDTVLRGLGAKPAQ